MIPIHNFKNKSNSQFTLRKLTLLDFYIFVEKKSGNRNVILKKKTSKKLCLSQQLVAWKGSWIAQKEEEQGIMKQQPLDTAVTTGISIFTWLSTKLH